MSEFAEFHEDFPIFQMQSEHVDYWSIYQLRKVNLLSSQISSIGKALICGARGPEFKPHLCQNRWVCFEIPLDKELTADCLVETRTKLGELIQAAMKRMWADQRSAERLRQNLKWCLVWNGSNLGHSGYL